MTGYDFEALLAVRACIVPPADGRTGPPAATLPMILGAMYSGEPYERGFGWEDVVDELSQLTNRQLVVRSLNRLRDLGLIEIAATPDSHRTPNEIAAGAADPDPWAHSKMRAVLPPLGRVMLACAGLDTPGHRMTERRRPLPAVEPVPDGWRPDDSRPIG